EVQIAPLDKEVRVYARGQVGCQALMKNYGIGPLVARTILAELGKCTRFPSSRHAVRFAGTDITVYQSDKQRAPAGTSAGRARPPFLGRCSRPPARRAVGAALTVTTYALASERLGHNCAALRVARKLHRRSYHAAPARRGGAGTRMTFPVRAQPVVRQMRRSRLPASSCRDQLVDGAERSSGRNASPSGIHAIKHHVGSGANPRSRTAVRLGDRAHVAVFVNRAHSPPTHRSSTLTPPDPRLTSGPGQVRRNRAMLVLILADMEGVAGVVKWSQTVPCRAEKSLARALYQEGRRLYTEEVNAAVRGAFSAGATDVVVTDL